MAVGFRDEAVCVLGGTGFVGRALVSRLVRDGWRVVVPTRSRRHATALLVLPGVDVIECDVHDASTLAGVLSGVDAVVNLIGILNEPGHDGAGFKRVHVDLVETLVEASRGAGVRKIVHMSALKASAERGPSHYLRTKGEGERRIANLGDSGPPYTIFQPSVIFGPGDSFVVRFARLMRRLRVLALPRLDARFAPVYVHDVVAAFCKALTDPATNGRTYQLCGPGIYSLREVLELTRKTARIRCVIVGLPDGLGRIQAFALGHLPGKLFSLDNYRSLSVASVCTDDGFMELGIEPHSLEAMLPTYLNGSAHDNQLSSFRRQAGR
jgi:uncharacterized protein YbjT (DUF2867 family)